MKAEVLSMFHMPWLTSLGLLIFFSLFVGMLVWVTRPGRQPLYEHLSRLPFSEEEHHEQYQT